MALIPLSPREIALEFDPISCPSDESAPMPAMESGVVMHPVNKLTAHGNTKTSDQATFRLCAEATFGP